MKRVVMTVIAVLGLGLIGIEGLTRILRLNDFPLYERHSEMGYVVRASQSGSFFWVNDWVFNDRGMGAEEYSPNEGDDLLLVGDSIVFGGNPIGQADRLGEQLEQQLDDTEVWPISASSWAVLNGCAYLRENEDIVGDMEWIVWVVNRGDFDGKSRVLGKLWHPQEYPVFASWFLLKKYSLRWDVLDGENEKVDREKILQTWGKTLNERKPDSRILVVWHPARTETEGDSLKELREEVRSYCVMNEWEWLDMTEAEELTSKHYRDWIHPNAMGNEMIAKAIANRMKEERR